MWLSAAWALESPWQPGKAPMRKSMLCMQPVLEGFEVFTRSTVVFLALNKAHICWGHTASLDLGPR